MCLSTSSFEGVVEFRHCEIGRGVAQNLVGLKLAVLPLNSLILSAVSIGKPARLPLSISVFFTHLCSVACEQAILAVEVKTAPSQPLWSMLVCPHQVVRFQSQYM